MPYITPMSKNVSCPPGFRVKGASARTRMSHTRFHQRVLDAIDRGERPAEAAGGVPMTDVWFEILTRQAQERRRIVALSKATFTGTSSPRSQL